MANLLVVDDDKDMCDVVSDFLENFFENIELAHTVPEAIGKIKTSQFNLVIVDLNLVSGSGLSVIKYSRRSDSPNFRTPILVVSGELAFNCEDYPLTQFLSKPFDQETLLEKIRAFKGPKKTDGTGPSDSSETHPQLLKLLKGSR